MEDRYYKTRELAEAAALVVNNQRVVNIERQGKICTFVFVYSEQVYQISNDYFFGTLMVNARGYHEAITRLKNRIFAGQKKVV